MTIPAPPIPPMTAAAQRERVSNWYLGALGLAQFGIFLAILSPVLVSMQLKAQQLDPAHPEHIVAVALPLGALGSVIGNPLFGALSDRTRTRWGRRRPWLAGGIVGLTIGLTWVAFSPDLVSLTAAWVFCQLASNAAFAAMMASFADNTPQLQRGRASGVLGLAQNLSVLGGTYLAAFFVQNLPVVFILPGLIGIVLVAIYVFVAPDRLPEERLPRFSFIEIVRTFWTNPFTNPDFGFAWWSRFLIIFGSFMFTSFRLLYMQDHLHLDQTAAVAAVAFGVTLYTIALLITTPVSGYLSDRLARRKVFVAGSTALFGVGLVILVFADSLAVFYAAEIVMGFAYGIYASVDSALVVDVLPDAKRAGKDLGVLNIANSLPQSFAPPLGAVLIGIGGGGDYVLMLWAAGAITALGALAIIPIRGVR